MDEHFRTAPLEANIPVLMGMFGVLYADFFGFRGHAVLPYDQYLHRLPAYLQQAAMESTGKSVDRDGRRVGYSTGQILFGEPGTNGQHSFYQLIHQGTEIVPADFIASARAANEVGDHQDVLLANFVAQTQALMRGTTDAGLAPEKRCDGNRPTNSILFDAMTPYNLGKLVAAYEHKIFVQGIVWNINSFDQMGVELGKQLAKAVLDDLRGRGAGGGDASTAALVAQIKKRRGRIR